MSDRDHDPPSHDEPTPGERDGEAKRPSPAPGKTSRVERYYGMIQRRHLDGPRDLEPRLTAVSGSAMPDDLFDAFALHLDPVQREAEFAGLTALDPMVVHAQAARGLTGAPTALPHGDAIQRSFGPDHDVSSIRAHVGGPAAEASTAIGARAYATGDSVAFASAPDLHTAAHEAAHIVQQRAGVQLYGGVGQAGDPYEQHADAVADRVVRGESAADLLAAGPSGGPATGATQRAVQRFGAGEHRDIGTAATGGKRDARTPDNPTGTNETHGALMIPLAADYALPHGEIIALAGDHFESIDQMRMFAKVTNGANSRGEIEYARFWKLGITTSEGKFDSAAKASQEKRYYALALNNRRHFSNPAVGDAAHSTADKVATAPDPANDPVISILGTEFHVPPGLDNAIHAYRYYHLRALATAVKAGSRQQLLGDALAEEAFGHHFLTDSFSAGHIRTERASVKTHWNARYPMFNHNLKGLMAEEVSRILADGSVMTEDLVYSAPTIPGLNPGGGAIDVVTRTLDGTGKLTLGDVMSGALHDYDNEKGLQAVSGGDHATLHGDGHLDEGQTSALVVRAARLGVDDVIRAYQAGLDGTDPKVAIASLLGADHLFAPERLIPTAKPDAEQGPGQTKPRWQTKTIEELFQDPQIQGALKVFANEQGGTIRGVIENMSADKKAAIDKGFIEPLENDPAGMLHRILNWTPSIGGLMGHNSDDYANDYVGVAGRTQGGLASLTYVQRERLIGQLLSGLTVGDDEDAILQLLRTARMSDVHRLIQHFGWERLRSEIDDGVGKDFEHEFPSDMY